MTWNVGRVVLVPGTWIVDLETWHEVPGTLNEGLGIRQEALDRLGRDAGVVVQRTQGRQATSGVHLRGRIDQGACGRSDPSVGREGQVQGQHLVEDEGVASQDAPKGKT